MNLKNTNCRMWIFILALFIGYTNAASPYIVDTTCGSYSTKPEDFNGTVCRLHIKDSDTVDNITVRSNSDDTSIYFNIMRDKGTTDVWVNVTIKKLLDRETLGSMIKIKLIITDKQHNEIQYEHSVYITDVNDNYPEFYNLPYTLDLDELPCNNNTIVYSSVHATDKDSGIYGSVTYSMTPKAQSETSRDLYKKTFSINPKNGSISLEQCLDYKNNSYYQFTLTAKDGGGLNTSVDFIVRVQDVQNMPPFFTGIPYMTEIDENIVENSSLVQINAKDGDTGVSNNVFYTISASSCGGIFSVDSNSGQITTNATNATIDRDEGSIKNQSGNCILTVEAKELNSPNSKQYGNTTANTNVTILVKDLDDNTPTFSNNVYKANITENAAKYVPLTLDEFIHVNDTDQDPKNAKMKITLQNENGEICENFDPSPNEIQGSGTIQILVRNSSFLDFETIKTTTIMVVATEVIDGTKSDSAKVTIDIIDVNDNSPTFNDTSKTLHVNESSDNGTHIGTITATDGDSSEEYKEIHYSINGGNNRFIVHERTGDILVNCSNCTAELDRETQNVYYMTYTARDIGNRSDSLSLRIELNDINDNEPIFLSEYYEVVANENEKKYNINGSALVKLEARDGDKKDTNNSEVEYTIKETSPENLKTNFTIITKDQSGYIYLKTPLDYEKLNKTIGNINITVEAKDKGNPAKSSTAIVILHVQDMNDNSPIFNSTDYEATVKEDAISEENNYTHVAQVFAHDDDCTERNSVLNYIIIRGGSDRFTINGRTGMVSVQLGATLDREITPNYTLEIIALDQGFPPRNSSTNMTITVTDVNDSPPSFNQSEYSVHIKENANKSEDVFQCVVTDLDLDSKLLYEIKKVEAFDEVGKEVNTSTMSANRSAVESYFGIDKNNGIVSVKGTLDRETAQRIILTLQVNDTKAVRNKPQTASATLTVQLLDVNDNKPQFSNISYEFSIIENALNTTLLGRVEATDKDLNRTITYSLSDGSTSNEKFKINSETGSISKMGVLDRETNPTEYLKVTAKDNGIPSLNNSANVTIVVIDFNDNAPIFGNFNRTVHLTENSPNGTSVISINASDIDEGPNGEVYFTIENNKQIFEINQTTGQITVKGKIDRESKSKYELKVRARDNAIAKKERKSTDTTITITIDDENDNSPNFTKTEYKVKIAENEKPGTSISFVSAKDKDEGDNAKLSYKIVENSTPNNNLFKINKQTGVISVNESLTDEIGIYNFTVVATDHGTHSLNGTADLSIEVTDVNTHAPIITRLPPKKTLAVYECANINETIHTFNYTDGDFSCINRHATFKMIANGNESSAFNVTEDGHLVVQNELDVTEKQTYTIAIQATDEGVPPLTSKVELITINVKDVNDHVPSFTDVGLTLNLKENTTSNGSVGKVTAHDEDLKSTLCYDIEKSNWTDYFSINKSDGNIYNKKKLDYEKSHSIEFVVKVTDCSIVENTTLYCGSDQNALIKKNKDKARSTINVTVIVVDKDDNPPVFRQKSLATGMRRQTEADTELELHLRNNSYISDADTPENGVLSWTFSNSGNITISPELQNKIAPNSGVKKCDDGFKHIFCITKNGTIVNNKFFNEDLSGYFIVTVNVSDKAGYDTAEIRIYLISDSQIVTMTIRDTKEKVASIKDSLLCELSRILGYTAVFDSIQDHKENGVLNTQSSDLKFHIVKPDTQAVLSGKESIECLSKSMDPVYVIFTDAKGGWDIIYRGSIGYKLNYTLFDKQANSGDMLRLQNTYNVMKVTQYDKLDGDEDTSSRKLTLILVAVTAAEALIIAIIIFVALSARNKFRRKLKAAKINTPDMEMHVLEQKEAIIPGSNLYSKQNNPLLNADIKNAIQNVDEDIESGESFEDVDIDENVVDDHTTVYDRIEEKEATMDMYNDDTFHSISSEDLLDATLNLHALRKSKESLDKISDDVDYDVIHHNSINAAAFINESFMEDLESTEI